MSAQGTVPCADMCVMTCRGFQYEIGKEYEEEKAEASCVAVTVLANGTIYTAVQIDKRANITD